jgi:VanZ family protein
MAAPTFRYGHFCDMDSLHDFVVVFSVTGRYSLLIRNRGLKGYLHMPTGQRHENRKKSTPLISDEVALVLYAALLATWIGCLLWSSLASHLPSVPRIFAWDKLQHFSAYAILMFFSGNFFRSLLKHHRNGWITGLLFTIGFGLLMEIAQKTLSASRQADWKDFVANTLGAGLVFAIALLKNRKKM